MTAAFVERNTTARVVRVDGHAEDIDRIAGRLRSDPGAPTVLDLADLTLGGNDVAASIGRLLDACDDVCIVVRRTSAALVLQRLGVDQRCSVFRSVGDALQARRLAEDGFGHGWAPDRRPQGRP